MSQDFYKVLGVDKNVSQDELKKQYRKLSKQYHPDLQQGKSEAEKKQAEEKFKEISEAYDTLSDPDKRKNYDMFGSAGPNGQGGSAFFNMHDFFRRHGDMFSDMFGMFGNHGGFNPFGGHGDPGYSGNENREVDGRDVKVKIEISLAEAISGVTREFDVNFNEACTYCNGTGFKPGTVKECNTCHGSGTIVQEKHVGMFFSRIESPCPECGGTGKISSEKCDHCHGSTTQQVTRHVKLNVLPGASSKTIVYGKDLGSTGLNGGKHGQLIINILVENSNSIFTRVDKSTLSVTCFVDPLQAIVGGKTKALTPSGWKDVEIKIDRAGNMLPSRITDGLWNIIVNFEIGIPTFDDETKQQIKEFRDKLNVKMKITEDQEREFKKVFNK